MEKTSLTEVYASVIMLDGQRGDAYVVDLNHGGTATDPKHWRRYVIDTGYPVGKGKTDRRKSLAKSVFKHESNEILPLPPWYSANKQKDTQRPNLPPLSGVIITHSDRDHFGNAPWLIDRLQQLKDNEVPLNNTYGQDYVMLSPMWAWTTQVVKAVTKKKPPKDEGADEVDDPPEEDGDTDVDADAHDSNDAAQLIPKSGEDVKTWNLNRFCDLEFGFTPNGEGVQFTLTHKKKLGMSTRKTWRNLLHLAKQARYQVMYRFNIVKISPMAGYKEWESERLTRLSRLHISKKDQFVTSKYLYRTTNSVTLHPAGQTLPKADDVDAKNPHTDLLKALEAGWLIGKHLLAEVILVPDTAVRSRPRTSNTSNRMDERTISGSWLRHVYDLEDVYVKQYASLGSNPAPAPKKNPGMAIEDPNSTVPIVDGKIEEERVQPLPPPSSDVGRYTGVLKDFRASDLDDFYSNQFPDLKPPKGQDPAPKPGTDPEDNETKLKIKQNQQKAIIDSSKKNRADVVQQKRSKEVGYCPRYFVVGLENTLWQVPLGSDDLQGHYSTSFLGCAGEEYVRDFAHYILQYKLSSAGVEPQYYDVGLEPNTNKIDDALKNSSAYKALDPDFKIKGLGLVKPKRMVPLIWGHYANRASIIAHFIRTRQRRKPLPFDEKFDNLSVRMEPDDFRMLFTGDALELGHGSEISYTPEKKITKNYFERDIAKLAAEGYMQIQPTGNLLTWLQRQQLMKATRIQVLKVPHHGSKTTTTAQFYHFISADVYLISGAWTPYGHPDPETIQSIFATIIREDGDPLSPSQFYSKANSSNNKLPHIKERKRPRLMFVTWQCNYGNETHQARIAKVWADNAKAEEKYETALQKAESEGSKEPDKPKLRSTDPQEIFFGQFIRKKCPNTQHRRPEGQAKAPYDGYPSEDIVLVNCRIFAQAKASAATRLVFGHDKERPQELRVEWRVEDWIEIRPGAQDTLPTSKDKIDFDKYQANPMIDPLAYPMLGKNNSWEESP